MKKTLLFALAMLGNLAIAQVTLPYATSFDSPALQTGWVQYQKGATNASQWGYSNSNPSSAPMSLSHDYAPATGITLVDDWYISPAFEIPNGGNLDSVRYMFSGFSVPGAGDTVAIYLLQGSPDPDLATKVLLFDFRDGEYTADNTYRTKTDLSLDAYSGMSYIAFRYRNSDVGTYWLTVHFDDVSISGNTASVSDLSSGETIKAYPNPTTGELFIENASNQIESIQITDARGAVQLNMNDIQHELVKLDLSHLGSGIYFVEVQSQEGIVSKRIRVE